MARAAAELREKWDAVELELLTPVALTDGQLEAIADIRQNGINDRKIAPFRETLSFAAARFKPEKTDEILAEAREKIRTDKFRVANGLLEDVNRKPVEEASFIASTCLSFSQDVQKIHRTLFDAPSDFANCEVGRFRTERQSKLHADDQSNVSPLPQHIVYIARIGALPFEVVDERRRADATDEEQSIIKTAQRPYRGKQARQQLRDMEILRSIPLGDVAVLLSGCNGTLHCSSVVPEGGGYSGFYRGFGNLSPHVR